MIGQSSMIYQLNFLRKADATDFTDMRLFTLMCLHMISEKHRLGETAFAYITLVRSNATVYPATDGNSLKMDWGSRGAHTHIIWRLNLSFRENSLPQVEHLNGLTAACMARCRSNSPISRNPSIKKMKSKNNVDISLTRGLTHATMFATKRTLAGVNTRVCNQKRHTSESGSADRA